MAASSSDVQALVAQLRGKGLGNAEVADALEGMGYTKAEARAAAGITARKTAAKRPAAPRKSAAAPKSAAGGARAAGGSNQTSTPPGSQGPSSRIGGLAMPSLPSFTPPDMSQVTLTPPKRLNRGDLGGFLAGVTLYAIFLNYLRLGPEGPKGWLSAKFLNRPLDTTTTGSSSKTKTKTSGTAAT